MRCLLSENCLSGALHVGKRRGTHRQQHPAPSKFGALSDPSCGRCAHIALAMSEDSEIAVHVDVGRRDLLVVRRPV